jgi:hypothetical protein
MTTIIVILAIWMLLSLPMSVILGHAMSSESPEPELVGMDGDVAVFRRSDNTELRVSLAEHTVA